MVFLYLTKYNQKLKLKQNKTKYTKTKHIISTYLITYLLSPIPQCTQNLSQIFYPDLIMYQQKVCLQIS